MALTPSTMQALGSLLPEFSLPEVRSGKLVSNRDFQTLKGLLVMFICRHCPYVKHVEQELARIGRDYAASPLGILAVSSNDAEHYPEDSPENLAAMADRLDFKFPFCYDADQSAARHFGAACTPDFFVYDGRRRLVYRGQLDASRPGNHEPVTGKDLRAALEAVVSGGAVEAEQKPSVGCNIKWKPGSEPPYFRK